MSETEARRRDGDDSEEEEESELTPLATTCRLSYGGNWKLLEQQTIKVSSFICRFVMEMRGQYSRCLN